MVRVRLYEGNIPKSGKTFFSFGGINLSHLSKVVDKSDFLIHTDTGAIIRAYPTKTERAFVLDDIGNNIDKLKSFVDNVSDYELYSNAKKKEIDKEAELDASCTRPQVTKTKRKFMMSDNAW